VVPSEGPLGGVGGPYPGPAMFTHLGAGILRFSNPAGEPFVKVLRISSLLNSILSGKSSGIFHVILYPLAAVGKTVGSG